MKRAAITLILLSLLFLLSSWGFYAHIRINRQAVFSLPNGMSRFYKNNISYLSQHAVDPDKRRYADTAEAARHYLDVELYEAEIDSIPRKYDQALLRYGYQKMNASGILPWHIQKTYFRLVNAFKLRDSARILSYSAALGHYLADANVPLHTTNNHNGQLSNQHGIHAFWESRLPELFAGNYNMLTGRAAYIQDPLVAAWGIVTHTHQLVDSVLKLEAQLRLDFPAFRKYSYSKRGQAITKQYAEAYAKAYHEAMNKMVERQMRNSVKNISDYWFSAWVDAGQPELENLIRLEPTPAEREKAKAEALQYKKGKLIGRVL